MEMSDFFIPVVEFSSDPFTSEKKSRSNKFILGDFDYFEGNDFSFYVKIWVFAGCFEIYYLEKKSMLLLFGREYEGESKINNDS